ncbi:hypothetical protein AB0H83_34715 [Dactylosporangium sp. NPDC050688]|uniref:hypothetical protein n=1 Tax=Dactylosporangium sp. NPDC050688 TaxID=3157217 RepID=UPI00340BBCAB
MVVRLVRAGVGALLLLIAVPVALAGGGLWVAMEHRAGDDTFTARLERLRSSGRAVVVPDIDALLRADAPFARGGQTTLSLSAVGSGGPLFIGLAEDTAVQRYLGGQVQAQVSRVRLARGPLPVELTEVETRAAAASAGRQGDPGAGAQAAASGEPGVGNPGATSGPDTSTGDPDTVGGDPGATAGDPNTAAGDPNATTGDSNAAAGNPDATAGNPDAAAAGPGATGTGTTGADPNATGAGTDPNATGADPNAANPAGANPADPNAAGPAVGGGTGPAAGGGAGPAGQVFWLAKSVTVDGAAQLTWSPSALRGRHLALVVMNADGTAGIDAAVTARLAPAWLGPTAGGLLMLGTAVFLLALLILAWPPRRAEERLVLPTLPSQPTKGGTRAGLRRNLSTLSDPIAALLNPVVPKNRDAAVTVAVTSRTDAEDDRQATTISVVMTDGTVSTADGNAPATDENVPAADESVPVADERATTAARPDEPTNEEAQPDGTTTAQAQTDTTETAEAQTDAAETVEAPTDAAPTDAAPTDAAPTDDIVAPGEEADGVPQTGTAQDDAERPALAESELDRPLPPTDLDDGPGPVALPPLPKLPPIELQFTWAPVAVDEQEEPATSR